MVMELNGGRLVFLETGDADIPERFSGAVLALVFGKGGKRK
jgi:hypothetical protein